MSGKWALPAWTGPDSPQTPVPVCPADCVLVPGHAGPHTDDGAPIHGGVTDPASTSGPGLPPYRAVIIASCPRCGSDLDNEGFGYWCPGCREAISAREACMFDEGMPLD